MKFSQCLLVLVLLFFVNAGCGLSKPDPIQFDFQGIRIGDLVDDELKAEFEHGRVDDESLSKDMELPGLIGFAYLKISIIDSVVEGITVDFSEIDFSTLRDGFVEKYGQPHKTRDDRRFLQWQANDGVFCLSKNSCWIHSEKLDDVIKNRLGYQKKQLQDSL